MAIEDGSRVKINYVGRHTDGTVFDTSKKEVAEESGLTDDPHHHGREYEPLEFEIGSGQVIEGLEDGLMGLDEGDEETITIPPEKGYGERRDDLLVEYGYDEFREMLGGTEPEEGMHIHAEDGSHGDIVHVDDETVRIDFNHELAGETIEFEVEVLEVN